VSAGGRVDVLCVIVYVDPAQPTQPKSDYFLAQFCQSAWAYRKARGERTTFSLYVSSIGLV
jgi:hypothetical protein